jgi:hypothetical protein
MALKTTISGISFIITPKTTMSGTSQCNNPFQEHHFVITQTAGLETPQCNTAEDSCPEHHSAITQKTKISATTAMKG